MRINIELCDDIELLRQEALRLQKVCEISEIESTYLEEQQINSNDIITAELGIKMKYYYSCPLQAAYMAKEFGIKCDSDRRVGVEFYNMFKPKIGDFVVSTDGIGSFIDESGSYLAEIDYEPVIGSLGKNDENIKIIMRDGKLFFEAEVG